MYIIVYSYIIITLIYACFHIEIHKFVRYIKNELHPDCPECKNAKLKKNGRCHFPKYANLDNIKDLYACEKCNKEFIPL